MAVMDLKNLFEAFCSIFTTISATCELEDIVRDSEAGVASPRDGGQAPELPVLQLEQNIF